MTKLNKYSSDSFQNFFDNDLSTTDPDLYNSIKLELERQQQHIELIASENIVSKAVLDAQGSIMTNKYAEGYSSKRYYGGCEFVDKAEDLAIERVKKLFNCKYANVQPHSGAQANGATFLALLNPGDTFMGMSLNSGGHITHGFGYPLPATKPEKCAISTIRYAPTLSAISLNLLKSITLEYALPPAIINFGLCSKASFSTLS